MWWKTQIATMLGFLFGASVVCSGQVKITLQDVSEYGTPLHVSGTISLQDAPSQALRYTYTTEGSVSNVSKRDVVLTVIHFDTSGVNAPGLDLSWTMDRFFGPVLRAGDYEEINSPPVPLGDSAVSGPVSEQVGPDARPTGTAEVRFVQFADGTTWGDADAGSQYMLQQRKSTLAELKRLEHVHNAQGADVFAGQFSNSAASLHFPAIEALVSKCKSKAVSCLIDGLHSMLQAAREHQEEMTNSQNATSSEVVH